MASERYRRMAEMYLRFAGNGDFDRSEAALEAQFRHESWGDPKPNDGLSSVFGREVVNAYTRGKAMLGIVLEGWMRDHYDGALPLALLYDDPGLPHWFLDTVLPRQWVECWARVAVLPRGDVRKLKNARARRMCRLPETWTPLDYVPA